MLDRYSIHRYIYRGCSILLDINMSSENLSSITIQSKFEWILFIEEDLESDNDMISLKSCYKY